MNNPKDSDDDADGRSNTGSYEVGFGKPPKQHQFKKGVSGNPRGRPTGTRGVSVILREQLYETVPVSVRGRTTYITKIEAVVTQLVNEAAKGNASARRDLLPLMQSLEHADSAQAGDSEFSKEDEQIKAVIMERMKRTKAAQDD